MKLKSLPASCVASTATAAPAAFAKLSDTDRAAVRPREVVVRPAAAESFGTFVRKLTIEGRSSAPAGELPSATITGAVVADTILDGVRYVIVRCAPRPTEALLSLSPRERDIVNLITKGYPNKMIAELLDISAWTVGTHLRRIFAKLGVTSRAAMVAKYLRSPTESPISTAAALARAER
jgi:two-component system, NarL family, nitrate/nitrite response regulator NarL